MTAISSENPLQDRLEDFLGRLPLDSLVSQIHQTSSFGAEAIAHTLQTFVNETRATLALVGSSLDRGQRALEVGAGICLFSVFLKREGFNIVALEPAMAGYEIFAACKRVILQHFAEVDLELLEIPAGELDPRRHGAFDLIFSNNVIEHIPDWRAALAAMLSVLKPGAQMRHACPNYLFPYEPHYAIPILKWYPQLSRRVFAAKIDPNPDIWDSLNFLSYCEIRRFASQHQVSVAFEPGLLYRALMRLDSDPMFRQRHAGGMTRLTFAALKHSGLIHLLRCLPAACTTPMQFSIVRN